MRLYFFMVNLCNIKQFASWKHFRNHSQYHNWVLSILSVFRHRLTQQIGKFINKLSNKLFNKLCVYLYVIWRIEQHPCKPSLIQFDLASWNRNHLILVPFQVFSMYNSLYRWYVFHRGWEKRYLKNVAAYVWIWKSRSLSVFSSLPHGSHGYTNHLSRRHNQDLNTH